MSKVFETSAGVLALLFCGACSIDLGSASGDHQAGSGSGALGSGSSEETLTVAQGHVRGILNCPTTPLPTYGSGSAVVLELSAPFRDSCATCHGGRGEGTDEYPAIPGEFSFEEFVAVVRSGRDKMPASDADFISDEELSADYATLVNLASDPSADVGTVAGPLGWTDAEVDAAYARGLEAFRTPGAIDGQACVNCHSPDGVELAIIGFSDDDILRRAQQHVAPDHALLLRDFVHAQRRRFGIAETCSPDWRPFQPGGEVLPGATPEEQDASFLAELSSRGLFLVTGDVVTVEDAERALAELQSIDLRQLPLGIPLPRFSEDKFHGPEHRDINDYMQPVPLAPNDPASYFALEDDYLAAPTDQNLYRLFAENQTNMNDLGYVAQNSVPRDGGNCPSFETSTAWIMSRITLPKRLNVLVTGHLFRQELVAPGSFYSRPASAFPDAPEAINPAFFLGGFAIEPPCYDNVNYPNWITSFPEDFRDEFPESDLAAGVVENATDRITHEWMMLGQLFDKTLIATDEMQWNKMHYWAERNFDQRDVHLPFVYAHRMAMLAEYHREVRGTPAFPLVSGPFDVAGREELYPLLANNTQLSAGLRSAVEPGGPIPAAQANRLKGNLTRMFLLLMKRELDGGAAIQMDQNYDHCLSVICNVELLSQFVNGLAALASHADHGPALAAAGFDFGLHEVGTRALLEEVVGLLNAAPRL